MTLPSSAPLSTITTAYRQANDALEASLQRPVRHAIPATRFDCISCGGKREPGHAFCVVANGALAKILWMMDGSYDDGAEYSASCRIRYCGEGPIHCETVLVRDLSRPAAQVAQ